MQNPYNNYLKRQKQQPMNNFKEKVRNSLSGKTINNTTLPNTAQSNIQSNIQQKARTVNPVNAVTPVSTDVNKIGTGTLSGVSTPVDNATQVNANVTTPNVSETPLNASEVPSVVSETGNVVAPEGGAGMMSLADINGAFENGNNTTSPMARSVDSNPNARATSSTSGTNYEQLLTDIKNQQLAQADKNWQTQQDVFNQQMGTLKDQFNQSKLDAENAYKESVDTLNEQRYNQMEELNISGTNRGIQYSPQQLGLENVANINHNKNLAQTSKNRNELLNKLQIEMNNALAQLNMTMVNAKNEHDKNILDIYTNYNNTLLGWNREDALTQSNRDWEQKLLEEKRKWEEAQAQKDKEFQQMMQEMQNNFDKEQQTSQNNWQSNENQLDREHETNLSKARSSSGGYSYGGGGGYSRGYSSYSRSYNPYSRGYYNGWNNYDGGSVDVNDEITQQAIDNKFKQLSTDVYNAVDTGGVYDLMERAGIYSDSVAPMYDAFYGLNKTVDERLNNTRETALKHLVNKSIARSTNGAYNIGDTVYQHKSPLRKEYIDKVNKTKEKTKNEVYQKYSKNSKTKFDSKVKANAESIHNKIMDKANNNKSNNKSNNKTNASKYSEINKKLGAKNVASIKKQQAEKQQNKAKKQEKAKTQQQKRIETNKKLGAKNQAYIKKQMEEKKKQQEKAKKFKTKVTNAVKKIFKKK